MQESGGVIRFAWHTYQKPAPEECSRFMAPVSGAWAMGITLECAFTLFSSLVFRGVTQHFHGSWPLRLKITFSPWRDVLVAAASSHGAPLVRMMLYWRTVDIVNCWCIRTTVYIWPCNYNSLPSVSVSGPCGARGRCRISPPRFLADCRKRRLNQGSFVSAVCLFVCFLWYVLCLCVYFCDLYWVFPYYLFVSNSQVIGCEDRPLNDLYCVGWGVKLCSIQSSPILLYLATEYWQTYTAASAQVSLGTN